MCPNQNAWHCLLPLWWLSPFQLMAAPRFQVCSSQAFDPHLLVPFFCLMPSISMNSIGSILRISPEPAPSHWCIVAPVKIWTQSFLCGDQKPFNGVPSNPGNVRNPKTYTISLLFLMLSSDSPFLTSRTSSPTSFPPAHSDSSPVAPIDRKHMPVQTSKVPRPECSSPRQLYVTLGSFVSPFMAGLFGPHKIAVLPLSISLFFYILLFSICYYLTSYFNLCIQLTRLIISHLYIPSTSMYSDKYRWNKMPC